MKETDYEQFRQRYEPYLNETELQEAWNEYCRNQKEEEAHD